MLEKSAQSRTDRIQLTIEYENFGMKCCSAAPEVQMLFQVPSICCCKWGQAKLFMNNNNSSNRYCLLKRLNQQTKDGDGDDAGFGLYWNRIQAT